MSQKEITNDKNIKKPLKQLVEVDDDDVKVVKSVEIDKNNELEIKKTSGRPNKGKVYVKNRQDVLNKISKILEFDGVSGIIFLDSITKEQQQNILDQVDDIKLYFNYASWSYFKKDDDDKTWLCLVKSLFKSMNYNVRQNIDYKKEGDIIKKISKMTIVKNK